VTLAGFPPVVRRDLGFRPKNCDNFTNSIAVERSTGAGEADNATGGDVQMRLTRRRIPRPGSFLKNIPANWPDGVT
jgi:hypothetical protein